MNTASDRLSVDFFIMKIARNGIPPNSCNLATLDHVFFLDRNSATEPDLDPVFLDDEPFHQKFECRSVDACNRFPVQGFLFQCLDPVIHGCIFSPVFLQLFPFNNQANLLFLVIPDQRVVFFLRDFVAFFSFSS